MPHGVLEDSSRYPKDWIFAPSLVRAKSIIAEGGIGKPLYSRGKECHGGSYSPFAQRIKYCGGGCVIHLAIQTGLVDSCMVVYNIYEQEPERSQRKRSFQRVTGGHRTSGQGVKWR